MIRGEMFVISGPSGVGKSTIVNQIINTNKNVFLSISATTRHIRKGEEEGVNYFYKTENEFVEMIERKEFLEWAHFCGHYYGTPKGPVEKMLDEGKDVILEIEIQGAMEIKKNFPNSIFIFIVPPTINELVSRITKRGTESEGTIALRMETAKKELDFAGDYDYILVNHSVDETANTIMSIISAERCRMERCISELEVLK